MNPANWANFVEVLQYRARHNPDLPVYNFIDHAGGSLHTITCGELERRACQIAAALAQHSAPGARVLLLYPPGIDYITALFGCMIAGATAVPAYPVEPAQLERTLPRLLGMVKDCDPAVVLTMARAGQRAIHGVSEALPLAGSSWLATDELPEDAATGSVVSTGCDVPAYLQYTSGSTGAPKGVMVSHGNLLHNSAVIERRFEHTADSRGVIWLPPYHDMGLIGGILQPLYVGFPVFLMSHIDFLKHPLRWLRAVSRFQATTSGGPNFAYELLATMRIASSEFEKLDLRSWSVAFTGAEPVRVKTLRAFAERFAPCGFRREAFYPCYGLAEQTLFVSGGGKSCPVVSATLDADQQAETRVVGMDAPDSTDGDVKRIVGCGHAAEDSRVLIVDPQHHTPCPDGEVGEIWAQGPSVAMGYWNQPELTAHTFRARLAHSAEQFLRTGDYGFKLGDELFVTGRLKDAIIIRGANHYPQDIEATLEEVHADLFRPAGCAVFAIEESAASRVVIVRELRARHAKLLADTGEPDAPLDELFRDMRSSVSRRHGIAVNAILCVPPATVPKTTSGKIQRHLCRKLFIETSLPVLAAWQDSGGVSSSATSIPRERDRRAHAHAAEADIANG